MWTRTVRLPDFSRKWAWPGASEKGAPGQDIFWHNIICTKKKCGIDMILRTWLNELDYELVRGSLDVEVTEVVYDSRKAVPGAVFVCMAGTRVDSHRFVPDVLRAGVRVLVTERDIEEELAASGLTEDEMGRVTILKTAEARRKGGDDRHHRHGDQWTGDPYHEHHAGIL